MHASVTNTGVRCVLLHTSVFTGQRRLVLAPGVLSRLASGKYIRLTTRRSSLSYVAG